MLECYSTEPLEPAKKIRRWCDFGSSTLSRLAVRPYHPAQFSAKMLRATLGRVGITHMTSSAALAESMADCVGTWAGSREGALGVTFYKAGHPRLTQAGRTVVLSPGDIVIRDLGQSWVHECSEDFALMTLKIPARACDGAFDGLCTHLMAPLRAGDPRADLLSSLIQNLGRLAFEGGPGADHASVERLLRSAFDVALPAAAVEVSKRHRPLPPRVTHYVARHLHRPELSVTGLARAMGLSMRSVQRLFHEAGTSPKAYILARRLDAAAQQLRECGVTGRVNITGLALSMGFNDPGYFARAFHASYGMTPTQYLLRHDGRD